MKKCKIIFLLSFILIGGSVLAQGYAFKVMVNKGDNMQKSSGGSWLPIKTGAKLNNGDEIKLVENSYLGLVHSSGRTKELKEAKTYTVSALSAALGSSGQSIGTKYADFVLSKMSPEQREENQRKYASVTGAVERGSIDGSINIFMPTSVSVYNPSAVIRWEGIAENSIYQVKLKNLFDEVIMVAETSQPFYNLDFTEQKIASSVVENLIIVSVSLKDNEEVFSKNAAIERISGEDTSEFVGELTQLKTNLSEQSSINDLILAEFYEENNLLLDALTSYEHAIKLSPDVSYFKEAYNEFLLRTGLK